jgi:hypothetical protein
MTPKQHLHIRISDEGRRQLDELCKRLGDTQEGVFMLALDRLYRDLSVTDDLREIFEKGILVDGRCVVIELDDCPEKPQEGGENDHKS